MGVPNKLCIVLLLMNMSCCMQLLLPLKMVRAAGGGSPSAAGAASITTLLAFKQGIDDPRKMLENWSESSPSPCRWNGVICDNSGSVIGLNLTGFQLNGTLSPLLCQLPQLQSLLLASNHFNQSFPLAILHDCAQLLTLDLSYNSFSGSLPRAISQLTHLTYLDLSFNRFTGPIPAEFGALPKLQFLHLEGNFLGPGGIPAELGNLMSLRILSLDNCGLGGHIPASLANLVELTYLGLSMNNLTGRIPSQLMNFPKLTHIELWDNQLIGEIPSNIGNLTSITDIEFAMNFLNGTLPEGLYQLEHLSLLHLYSNNLSGGISDGLAGLTNISDVQLWQNQLTGWLPQRLGLKSSLEKFDVSENLLTGPIPPSLCFGGTLEHLSLFQNKFSGNVPESYGQCPSITYFSVNDNRLEGVLPNGIWGSANLKSLYLKNNNFSGIIPPAIGNASKLFLMWLQNNRFNGGLPAEIGHLSQLSVFSAASNFLSGPIPPQLGNCSELNFLNLSHNTISGQIPQTISRCTHLATLDLGGNALSGAIPGDLSSISQLTYFDVSQNHLYGSIPSELSRSTFKVFNVSFNDLSGTIPNSLGSRYPRSSFEGNPELCGAGLPNSCHATETPRSGRHSIRLTLIILGVLAGAAGTAVVAVCFARRRQSSGAKSKVENWEVISFQRKAFSEDEILHNMDKSNAIGSGGTGKVYKATLPDGQSLAVKEILMKGSKDIPLDLLWRAEVETLGMIKHKNVVKLLCSCSSDKSKLLVYEYMPNGSLGDLLHGKRVPPLDWPTRYEIAFGAAEGLAYLHHDCSPQILHRDIKSNNILIDSNYEARLADFGVAKFVEGTGQASMSAVVGSIGYIAPEYAYTLKVSEKSDVYSYGVVLMELITGKRPIEPEFGEGRDVVRWVYSQLRATELMRNVLDAAIRDFSDEASMFLVLKAALHCTSALPEERPSMREVVELLRRAKPQEQQRLELNQGPHNRHLGGDALTIAKEEEADQLEEIVLL